MGAEQSISSDAKLGRGAKPARKKAASHQLKPEVAVGATFMLPFEAADGPPWLVDEKPSVAKKAKAPSAKKAVTKAKPKLAKHKATKKAKAPIAKRTAATRVRKSKPEKAVVAVQPNNHDVPAAAAQPMIAAPAIAAPLPRAQAPVIWQKSGPLDAISYWLRTTTKTLVGRLRGSGERKGIRIAKPRTRQQLLLEVAVLREENAKLRVKLGLPSLPFGRQIVDTI